MGMPRQFSLASNASSKSKSQTGTPNVAGSAKVKKQYSNLFPCPLVRTFDLDSPDGCPSSWLASSSSLASVSGSFPFASAATMAAQQQQRRCRRAPPIRARSVQSSGGAATNGATRSPNLFVTSTTPPLSSSAQAATTTVTVAVPCTSSHCVRQLSLPAYTPTFRGSHHSSRSVSPVSPSLSPSPRLAHADTVDEDEAATPSAGPQRRLCSARSMHAQTHKLKRQVTICEDSVSIAESVRSGSVRKRPQDHARRLSASPSPVPLQRVASPPPVLVEEEDVFVEEGAMTHAQRMALLPRQESSFTQEEIHSLQAAFAQLDLNGDGRLSRKEVETALGNILSENDLNDLLLDLDTDQNGEVEWVEFLQVMKARMREPESVKMLKEAFRVLAGDSSEGQIISAEDMKRCLMFSETRSSEREVDEMLRVLDLDGDGKVRMDDFVRLLVSDASDGARAKRANSTRSVSGSFASSQSDMRAAGAGKCVIL